MMWMMAKHKALFYRVLLYGVQRNGAMFGKKKKKTVGVNEAILK
jgi:hypothetical protein